jgi:hypothetical protein
VSKITGLGTAATLTAGTAANNVVQLDGSARLPAVSGANLTGVSTDTSAMENNIAILAFKTQSSNNLAKFNLVDQVIDEYKDATGVTFSTAGQDGSTAADGYLDSSTLGVSSTAWPYTTFASQSMAEFGSPVMSDHPDSDDYLTVKLHGSSTAGGAYNALGHWAAPSGYSCGFAIDYLASYTWSKFSISNYVTNGVITDFRLEYTNEATPSSWTTVSMAGASVSTLSGMTSGHDTGISGFASNGIMTFSNPGAGGYAGGVVTGFPSFTARHIRIAIGSYTTAGNSNSGLDAFIPYYNTMATNATGTATSTANTALTAPTTGDICMLIENFAGTATLNTDLKAYVSRNGGTGWDQVTLADKGSWGTNKKILTANNVAFSNSASGTDMRYKIEWANQGSGTKETRVHATSLAWA